MGGLAFNWVQVVNRETWAVEKGFLNRDAYQGRQSLKMG